MGLFVPHFSPFVYSDLKVEEPGVLFFFSQLAFPAGALLFGTLSDKTLHIRRYLVIQIVLTSVFLTAFGLTKAGSLIQATIYISLMHFFIAGINPLINVSYLQNNLPSEKLGQVRMYGTIGFLIPNIVTVFFPVSRIILLILAAGFIALSLSLIYYLPSGRSLRSQNQQKVEFKQLLRLLFSPLFLFFLFIMFLFYFQFAPAEFIVSEYLREIKIQAWNIPLDSVSLAWVLSACSEIFFFSISPFILKRTGSLGMIAVAVLFGMLRYTLMILILPGSLWLIFIQILHGWHYGPAYLGSVLHAGEKAHPSRQATAQSAVLVLSKAAGAGWSGLILGNLAGNNNFVAVFSISLMVALAALLLLVSYYKVQKKIKFFVNDNQVV